MKLQLYRRIKILGGLIPNCSSCKKIRDDKGYWDQLEGYIQSQSEAKFSHGVCPECAEKLYGKYYAQVKNRREDTALQVPPYKFIEGIKSQHRQPQYKLQQ
jgi:hypothetical protein